MLIPTASADSATTADALLNWFSLFGVATTWISDQGSHFKNAVVTRLAQLLRIEHNFTLSYTPHMNGTVERLNRDILTVFRVTLHANQLPFTDWPFLVPVIQLILNSSVGFRGFAPIHIFTGLPPVEPLELIMHRNKAITTLQYDDNFFQRHVAAMQHSLAAIHLEVRSKRERRALRALQDKSGRYTVNFNVGDFVLLSMVCHKSRSKLSKRYTGPWQVTEALTNHVYRVQQLIDDEVQIVHAMRLKLYSDSSLNLSADETRLAAYDESGYEVDCFIGHRFDADSQCAQLEVRWVGFPESDTSFVDVQSLYDDVPALVLTYLAAHLDVPSLKSLHQDFVK
jgi:hypothetical protein